MDHGVTVDFYWKLQQKGQATVAYTARAESWKTQLLKLYPTHTLPWTIKDIVTEMLLKHHFLRILICSTYYQQHGRSSPLKHNARWVNMIADRRISYRVQLCDSARKNLESLRNSSVWSCSQTYSASRVSLDLPRQFYVGRAKGTPLAGYRSWPSLWG